MLPETTSRAGRTRTDRRTRLAAFANQFCAASNEGLSPGSYNPAHLEQTLLAGLNQVPAFTDAMTYVDVSPYWNVPPSIAKEETVPQAQQRDFSHGCVRVAPPVQRLLSFC